MYVDMRSDLLVFIIRSDMRASLSQETLNDFLSVKESMGLVATFDPRQNCKILQNSLQNG